jgi:hypothetical protein
VCAAGSLSFFLPFLSFFIYSHVGRHSDVHSSHEAILLSFAYFCENQNVSKNSHVTCS